MNKELGPRKRVIITAQLHGNWNSAAQLLGQFDQWIVVESNIFFEAYRHVLGCLQKFFDDSFPLKEHLIRLEKPIAPGTLLSEPFNLLNTKGASRPYIVGENLPFEPTDMNLNESQAAAFQLALSNNVALIQGPPGTGKSYIGVKLVERLLVNRPSKPILLVCFTNHALDQFLADIIEELPESYDKKEYIVRVGARCQHETVNEFGIFQWKQRHKNVYEARNYLRSQQEELKHRVQELQSNIDKIKQRMNPLYIPRYEDLETIMSLQHRYAFEQNKHFDSNILHSWILQSCPIATADENNAENNENKQVSAGNNISTSKEIDMEHEEQSGHSSGWTTDSSESSTENAHSEKTKIQTDNAETDSSSEVGAGNNISTSKKTDMEHEEQSGHSSGWTADSSETSTENDRIEKTDIQKNNAKDDVFNADNNVNITKQKNSSHSSRSRNDSTVSIGEVSEHCSGSDSDSEDYERRLEDEDMHFLRQLEEIKPQERSNPPENGSPLDRLRWAVQYPCLITAEEVNKIEIHPDFWEIPWIIRRNLFVYWVKQFRSKAWEEYAKMAARLEDIQRLMAEYKLQENKIVFSSVKLIAMTTTGAARYGPVLAEIGCETVVVEEAAEIFEAHLIASLSASCKHLILIGDHVQLRPKVQVFRLEREHRLDVSLFERLILNDFPRVRLNTQHRMIPEISKLMTVFYDDLQDHETTRNRQSIKGVTKNMMFIHHDKPESSQADMSKQNEYEADFALAVAYYFIQQGYPGERITILSLYLGQRQSIARKQQTLLDKLPSLQRPSLHRLESHIKELQSVKVCVCDNYQGEENDIVILSLVRNNSYKSVGFLKVKNRICVALSRARNGLFILGNSHMLEEASKEWRQILEILKEGEHLTDGFEMRCINHPNTIRKAFGAKDISRMAPLGGCTEICNIRLACGHKCEQFCHPLFNGDHESIACQKPCDQQMECNHKCSAKCHFPKCHPQCLVKTSRILACSHIVTGACYDVTNLTAKDCSTSIFVALPGCNHEQRVSCGKWNFDKQSIKCDTQIEADLPCGHPKMASCYMVRFSKTSIKCKTKVTGMLPCEHRGSGTCHQMVHCPQEIVCNVMVKKQLDCKHEKTARCQDWKQNTLKLKCEVEVIVSLPCYHERRILCHENSSPDLWNKRCEFKFLKRLSCGHLGRAACCDFEKSRFECSALVQKTLPCGHAVEVMCSKQHEPIRCSAKTTEILTCGHSATDLCYILTTGSVKCKENCRISLPCGHDYKGRCYEIRFQAAKLKCTKKTTAMLDCGHSTTNLCHLITTKQVNCVAKSSVVLPCGHTYEGECNKIQFETTEIKCLKVKTGLLDCGHPVTAMCYLISARLVKCIAMDSVRLPCGHLFKGQCHNIRSQASSFICREIVRVSRDSCEHTIGLPCYLHAEGKPLPPCDTFVKDYKLNCGHLHSGKCRELTSGAARCPTVTYRELSCGHTIRGVCHRLFHEDHKCLETVNSRLRCGHMAKIPCWTKGSLASVRCMREIEASFSPCGHRQMIKCFESTIDLSSIECKHPCDSRLICGCQCSGTCHTCKEGWHPSCSAQCNKILFCGHACDTKCPQLCGPCTKACPRACRHRKCAKRCSEVCEPCLQPCGNECFHRKCKKRCGQVCDVEPCTHPCRRRLPCTHPCLGLCGDTCPRICAICNRDQLLELTVKYKDLRFVQIQECDHILGVKYLDLHMKESEPRLGDWPCCPICSCSIRKSFRYQKTLNEFYQALNERKKAIIAFGSQPDSTIGTTAKNVLDEAVSIFRPNVPPLTLVSISYPSVECVWRRHTLLLCSLLGKCLLDHYINEIPNFSRTAKPILGILCWWYITGRFSIHELFQICQRLCDLNNSVSSSSRSYMAKLPQDWKFSECRAYIVKASTADQLESDESGQFEELNRLVTALRSKEDRKLVKKKYGIPGTSSPV
eukprot:Gregarina_sp_Poly_1__9912@NODE_649_length_6956_cov_63_385832_g380_i2_p1_GENE_NODE_649_length_6956_cov_63_385832_g380_i2NODE_649_length_6956_cov_63_385832_g380_i2_p1_ORF_typecomplete_len2146_score230_49AAA_12/PF13087_6/4_4e47AAA_11/PF13086_6/7_3e27AAA_11/PF13086_6/1_4e16AAA_30/PF13604_6/1_1e09AAA_30/PF13604_6/0_019Viral_helicase1/PF01443_18/1_1Viral_helicase1/PF01443_18/6e07AAA_19/PF13245_6/1_5e08ResIII/PF04851_15/1_1e06ResIII/PF04851_15/2_1e03UvrDhelicase/PF00580_21/3_3e05DUF2075/PF09848_9/1_2e0